MMINLDDNWKWKYFQRPYYRLKEGISNFYYKHHKKIYRCRICGLKESPFLCDSYNSLPNEFGWHQFKDGTWACHHCVDHYGDKTAEEWNNMVKRHNKILYQNLRKMGYINESSKK